jgi:hypothetical protein
VAARARLDHVPSSSLATIANDRPVPLPQSLTDANGLPISLLVQIAQGDRKTPWHYCPNRFQEPE